MNTVWLVQQTKDTDPSNKLIYAAEELGLKVHVSRYRPFEEPDLSFLPEDQPVVFHGAIGCVRSWSERKLPIKPFAWFDFDKLSCHNYYSHWGEFLAVPYYMLLPVGDLHRLTDHIFNVCGTKKHGSDEIQVFIRPDTNDKLFTGEVVAKGRFDSFMNWIYVEENISEQLCVVAPTVNFVSEWRLFIADGKVVAGSQYKDGYCLHCDPSWSEEATVFAEKVAAKWSPHPFYVLDVGLLTDGNYRVVECGSANCAGIYQADPKPIVEAMSRIAEREFNCINNI